MADFNDTELFAVFDKTSSSVGAKKKGAAASQKRKRLQEATAEPASSSKRSKKGPQRVPKAKPEEVVVIKDSSDELEEVNVSVKSTEPPAAEKIKIEKDSTDGWALFR